MYRPLQWLVLIVGLTFSIEPGAGQQDFQPARLDLTGDIASPLLESSTHQPLPEQYIWLPAVQDGSRDQRVYFLGTFDLKAVPPMATLYVAGPDHLRVFVNGRLAANAARDPRARLKPLVQVGPIAADLRPGRNTVAIEASGGGRLAVKIVPRAPELEAPALLVSDGNWKCSAHAEEGWEQPGYSAGSWGAVLALGGIETSINFLEWNSDAGMYQWPGYDGISPFLAHLTVPVESIADSFDGLGRLMNLAAIAPADSSATSGDAAKTLTGEFTVILPPATATREEYPFILLDLGRESDGRLELVSDSDAPAKVELQYGESREEAVNEPYLGVDALLIPPHSTAHGPKSAFRYALVRFLGGNSPQRFKAIRFDSIYYPVTYQGSFESSDPLLNRIWQVGAYTSHLSMQDEIWDAPKRDRFIYGGDLNVSGRVIDTVFADRFLMQRTMDHLIPGGGQHVQGYVNGIPSYSAFWVMDQADYYRHMGDHRYLQSIRVPLTGILDYMQTELEDRHLQINPHNMFPFVDWSPDLNGDTTEVRRATTLEFAKAFAEGAWLLSEAGDTAGAEKFGAEAERIRLAARRDLVDPGTGVFGPRWQTNAMAIFSGVANEKQTADIWQEVLSRPHGLMISPYYNFYVINAMAVSGHRREALDWIREYWGGMVKEGATSFWEGYDPAWPKKNFHESLQSDNGQGYFVSLCHGWSSGPTAWLIEQILGIEPQGGGFSKVNIRPDLAGLDWARGAEPTPLGAIRVDLRAAVAGLKMELNLPAGVDAEVSMPAAPGETTIQINGQPIAGRPAENGARLVVELKKPGAYGLESLSASH
jgi:hypothetical protein